MRVAMHDTISTDETPQNENAASRSARHHTLGSGVQYKILKKSGPLFSSILDAEPSKKVMPP